MLIALVVTITNWLAVWQIAIGVVVFMPNVLLLDILVYTVAIAQALVPNDI